MYINVKCQFQKHVENTPETEIGHDHRKNIAGDTSQSKGTEYDAIHPSKVKTATSQSS